MKAERKVIKAGNQLIHQTIYNQAGSIQKALLEYIMNSVDAKATEIRICIAPNGIDYTIQDNGDGFGDPNYTTEEKKKCIDEVFGYLGFDHGADDENYRVYGKFGIGRAQLWAFSKNHWHTHNMTMEVDIKNNGMEYDIMEVSKSINGCHITGQFYDAIMPNEIVTIKRELAKMSAFAPIEVYFNDTKINRSIDELKSSIHVDNVHVELKSTSTLKVYNQGIFIREYPNYTFGTGGTVCSEVGYPFELNAARNDILQSRCKLWKKLKIALDRQLGLVSTKTKMNDDIRQSLLNKIAGGQYRDNEGNCLLGKPLIKMINNRYISIKNLISDGRAFTISNNKQDQGAEYIHDEGNYVVLLSAFTDALGVNDEDFVDILNEIKKERYPRNKSILKYTSIDTLKMKIDSSLTIIPVKKLTKRQKLFLEAINMSSVHNAIIPIAYSYDQEQETTIYEDRQRKVVLGKSQTNDAWTDGKTFIAINEDLIKDLDRGAGHALKIMHLLVHEYEHNDDNTDLHSIDFYKNYHDKTIDDANSIFIAFNALISAYTTRLIKNDFVIPKKLNRSLRNSGML